jgi:nicotinic acid mononucleotide adenylyltransferase
MPSVSSTAVREKLAGDGEDPQLSSLLPQSVLRYIAERKLYR